jgi:glycosyltransferase involved in cell wall biosynthesis
MRNLDDEESALLHVQESDLVPARWDAQFTALHDVGLRAVLPRLRADVLVTVTPGLLAVAEPLRPPGTALLHQEHRSTSERKGGLEPLLLTAPRADAVALLTADQRDWLADRLGAAAPRLVVVPNPLPPGRFPRSPLDSRTVVTAGRLVAEKQFPQLVAAFASVATDLPGWRLRIFGEGPKRGAIEQAVRRHGVTDRVDLPGSTLDLAREWGRAALAALSSKAEGYPLVLQEAMAAGVPCVSYDCPSGPREIITHGRDGLLVPPDDAAALGSALRRLALDDDLRRRFGAAALARSAEWEPAALAARWERILAEVSGR